MFTNYPFKSNNLQGNIATNVINENNLRYGFGYQPQKPNCKDINYKTCSNYSVMFGANKPIKEQAPVITGNLTYDPNTSCNNIWNNSTKRKIIVNN